MYAQRDGEWVTEESPANPLHERGQILRATEKLVLTNGGIVARLAGIYGPQRSALLKKFLNDEAFVNEDRFVNQIHRDDAAKALRFLLDRQLLPNDRILNVADNEPMQLSDCYRALAEKLKRDWSPQPSARSTSSPRKRGESNKRVRNAKLRALGWQPRFPSFTDGIDSLTMV